jgi:putative ATP-binding cassette transporter
MKVASEDTVQKPGIDCGVALEFMRYTRGFWRGPTATTAWLLTFGLAGSLFLKLLVDVATNRWNRWFFDALEKKDAASAGLAVLAFLGLVAAVAAVGVGIVLTRERLQVRWREWCTAKLLDSWLSNHRFYRMTAANSPMQNPEYRISDDVRMAIEPLTDFAIMLLTALLAAVTFAGILWSVGGSLNVTFGDNTYRVPAFMLLGAIIYGVTMSSIIPVVGKNLSVAASRKNEAEAKFRFEMIRLRENSEGVIMAQGETHARQRLFMNYTHLVRTWLEVVRQHGLITWVTNSNGAMIPVVPLILCAPKYIAGELTLGEVMQLASAFIQVQVAISWLVDHYRAIAEWFASARRITELVDSFHEIDEWALGTHAEIMCADSMDGDIYLCALRINDQTGRAIISEADLHIGHGEKIQIIGEAGSGKSVLVQAISGIWPWGKGSIKIPSGSTMSFIAAAPFLPAGTLREALTYPSLVDFTDQNLVNALEYAGLSSLASKLDETARWDVALSASERQRLAIARIFSQRPDVVIMEDALSALDTDAQTKLIQKIVDIKPDTTILFIGSASGLTFRFDRTFHLEISASGNRLLKSSASFFTQEPT